MHVRRPSCVPFLAGACPFSLDNPPLPTSTNRRVRAGLRIALDIMNITDNYPMGAPKGLGMPWKSIGYPRRLGGSSAPSTPPNREIVSRRPHARTHRLLGSNRSKNCPAVCPSPWPFVAFLCTGIWVLSDFARILLLDSSTLCTGMWVLSDVVAWECSFCAQVCGF
jgi:hypothetical protein